MSRLLIPTLWLVGMILSVCASSAQEKKPAEREEPLKPATVVAGEVIYVVAKSFIGGDGKQWTVVLEATSKGADRKILIESARAITPEGKTFLVKSPMGRNAVALPEDTKILIELKMGDLPKSVSTLARIELYGNRTVGIPGFEFDRKKGGFGTGKPLEVRPLVLKAVPVDRPEK
jgi:hypothetical protein